MPEIASPPTQNLETLPERMRSLERDPKTGWVVPYFVGKLDDGTYDLRMADTEKFVRCIQQDLCWVCGNKLGAFKVMVLGPMCAITGVSSEPPSHLECARWSVQNCPFLSRPHMRRRDTAKPENSIDPGGNFLKRNPGVTMLWVCRNYELLRENNRPPLIGIGAPVHVEFWAEGRLATRTEIEESIRTGLPFIEDEVRQLPDAIAAFKQLGNRQRQLEVWLPKEGSNAEMKT